MDMSPELRTRLAQHEFAPTCAITDRSHVAVALMAHWAEHGGRSTFRLFVEVALPLLDEIATDVRRDVGVAVAPGDLSAAFIQGQFLDLEAPAIEPKAFWRHARRELNQLAELEVLRFQTGGYAPAGALDVLDRLAAEVATDVGQSFHELDRQHRSALLAVEVDGLADYEVAEVWGCDTIEVNARVEAARDAWLLARRPRTSSKTSQATVADLIYELAKAVALSDAAFGRSMTYVQAPRRLTVIQAELRSRLGSPDAPLWLGSALDSNLAEDPCTLAAHLLRRLREMEGPTPRCQITLIHLLLRTSQEQDVDVEFERAFSYPRINAAERLMLVQALLRVLVRSDRYEEASTVIAQLPSEIRDTPEVALSGAAIAAEQCRVDDYMRWTRVYTSRPTLAAREQQPAGTMTTLEYVSTQLGRPLSLVMRDFGLSGGASLAAEGVA